MAGDDKRKSTDKGNIKKTKSLVKLNGKSDERYDNYGYRIEKPRPRQSSEITRESSSVKSARPHEPESVITPPKKEKRSAPSKQHESLYKSSRSSKTQRPNPAARKELSSHERRISERAPKRKKNILLVVKVGLFILLVACTILLILYNKEENENTPKTTFVSTGTIENSFHADVHMIRDESAVTAGFSGKLIAAVNEGDRVAAGTVIAYVVKPEYESDLKKLRDIEDKIAAAQSASSYLEISQSTEISTMNENIQNLTYQLSALSGVSSGMRDYSELIKKLGDLFRMKNDIMMNAETADAYITALKNERETVLARLENSMHEIKTQQAGVVSFYADSESQNASGKAQAIAEYISKKGETGNLLSETALSFENTELRYSVGADVRENDIVARITPDVTYYLAADITGIDYSGLNEGKTVLVKASGREFSINATVQEVLKYGDKMYLLLKSSAGIAGTISRRVVQSDIVVDYCEGIKVPKRALTEWDTARLTARITIVRSNYVSYVYVNVLAEDSEYAIISNSNGFGSEDENEITNIRINDLYVVNYEKVTEGQIIGG